MTPAKVDKRARRGAMTRAITYQRVLLAVYMLSGEDGVACDVPAARIGLECGHSVDVVSRSLKEMERRGVISTLDQWDGLNRKVIVLMDHDGADDFIAEMKARVVAKRREEIDRRAARVGMRKKG